jgi:hypothetical protein
MHVTAQCEIHTETGRGELNFFFYVFRQQGSAPRLARSVLITCESRAKWDFNEQEPGCMFIFRFQAAESLNLLPGIMRNISRVEGDEKIDAN